MNIKDDLILSKIKEGYLVGGAVRDFLMGIKSIADRDIAIKNAEKFAHKLENEFNGTFIPLDTENKIYRIVMEDKTNYVDVTELQGNTIEEDLLRRDFRINAIAVNLKTSEIIDPLEGMKDIQNRILSHIRDENFSDDPLRILRAFRFISTTGFKPSDKLLNAINKYKNLVLNPSRERITYEIMKLFGGKYCADTLLLMDKCGVLEMIFPCINEFKQVPPNSHHHLDLFHHLVETVRNIEILYKNCSSDELEHLNRVDFGGFPRINHLKLAGFLHDLGKFSTWTIEEDTGRHRFIKHDDVGAKMCIPILRELKFSKKQIEYVSFMIKNHIYPSNVIVAPDMNEKVMMRYLRKMGENVIDNIFLAKADRLSARGEDITDDMIKSNLEGLDKLLGFYFEKRETMKPLPKLLDGNEVMKILSITPSHRLGEIMSALKEAQISGEVNTKEEAVTFVKNNRI